MPLSAMKCVNCGHEFDLLQMPSWDKPTNQDRDGADCENLACVVCGSEERVPAPSTIMKSELVFPYFDYGLGREITSHGHRRAVMHELGVEEAGGERGTWADMADAEASAISRDQERYDDYVREQTEGPARGEFAALQREMAKQQVAALEQVREQRQRQRERHQEFVERAQHAQRRK
jgi:hypothetical protein